ncbi:AfsR family transcriptional regulator [Streptomyces sp. TR1341]|uniref:BTAD domain-containing putative transcriptional regulator n=1 Tax=Streptomyces sp. TR1341 TaxID=2601266 RepID=UPI00138AE315|nr:AfsR family transcriptional regulator [Streptomyces sp. TR1341]
MDISISAGRHRSLLAALLMRPNQLISADSLVRAVWDDEEPLSDGLAALRNYVARLRRVLGSEIGGRIITRSPGYLMKVADDELDVLRFTTLVRRARSGEYANRPAQVARDLAEALALWRGMPLVDIPARAYHQPSVDHLQEMRLQALELRIGADLRLGAHREVIGELRRLVAAHPTREPFHQQLMLALHHSGFRAEALDAFRDVRQMLINELGIEPGAALQELHGRILAGDQSLTPRLLEEPLATGPRTPTAPPTAPVPAEIPAAPRDFTGRTEAVGRLVKWLTSHHEARPVGASDIITVTGAGGVGKSALALHAAGLTRGGFPDGQLYANLRGSGAEPARPAEVLTRFLRSLGMPPSAVPTDLDELACCYRTMLAERRVLVVLDDAADTEQVRPLLPGTGANSVLVTSRSHLADLESASRLHLRGLAEEEARELFGRIAGADRLASNPRAVAQVLTVCGGLPVAVRIAAARLHAGGSREVLELADQLVDPERRLGALQIGDLGLLPLFDSGFAQLLRRSRPDLHDVDPAYAFRMLGLIGDAAISAAGLGALLGRRDAAVRRAWGVLVDSGMLEARPSGDHGFHPLLAAYAAERAEREVPPHEREEALGRLMAWRQAQRSRIPAQPGPDRVPASVPDRSGERERGLVPCAF